MPKYKSEDLKNLIDGNFEPIYFSEFLDNYKRAKDDEHKNILFLAYITGLRPTEAKRIVKQDIERQGNYLKIKLYTAKRGVNRMLLIPLSSIPAKNFLEYWKSFTFPKEYLFPNFAKRNNPRMLFIYRNKLAGIGRTNKNGEFEPFSFYVFRHNILTLLAEYGADFVDLQLFKGAKLNKSLFGSASYYLHRSSERMKKIAKILKKIMSVS